MSNCTFFRRRLIESPCILGTAVVNVGLLRSRQTREQRKNGQKLGINVVFTADEWRTKNRTPALLSGRELRYRHATLKEEDLNSLELHWVRFKIDADDLEVGESLRFGLECVDKSNNGVLIDEDDNDGLFYVVSCSPKLSPWAEYAAKELNNTAPTVKFNKNFYV